MMLVDVGETKMHSSVLTKQQRGHGRSLCMCTNCAAGQPACVAWDLSAAKDGAHIQIAAHSGQEAQEQVASCDWWELHMRTSVGPGVAMEHGAYSGQQTSNARMWCGMRPLLQPPA